jgi:hypothetical protein
MKKFRFGAGLLFLGFFAFFAKASDAEQGGIQWSGFVKTDVIYDTRQTEALREGHFLLYPLNESKDAEGKDIHAGANLNILAIQTRLTGTLSGPDAFGAKTSGLIEGSFFGHSNGDINGFRLRHAFLSLKWLQSNMLIGQFWHPMFVTDVFPGTISFNTGAPFQPFSRNPQVRYVRSAGRLNLIAAAISQRDFTSNGPAGSSSSYLRNAAVPNLHLQLQLKTARTVLGFGGDWKRLKPRLVTEKSYRTDETVSGLSFLAYAKFIAGKWTWKMEGISGQNLTDHLMLGGYAVQSLDDSTGREAYLPTGVGSFWTDLSVAGKVSAGCFLGYTVNRGAEGEIRGKIYGRGDNIKSIMRIAPRLVIQSGKNQWAAELEYTVAAYGTADQKGQVQNTKNIANVRLLLAAYFYF